MTPELLQQPTTALCEHVFRSRFLPGERKLTVFVPPGYDADPDRRYPVLYMQDGQNLFDPAVAFGGIPWRVDETARTLVESSEVSPAIIVGVWHAGDDRIQEYTPTKDKKLGGGRADLYGRMLVEEIKQLIDFTYRTQPAPQNAAIGGSSLGGLVSLYLGLQRPDVFGAVVSMSPSLWWGRTYMARFVRDLQPRPRLNIWLDMGTAEDDRGLQAVRRVRDVLEARGWEDGEDLRYLEVEGGQHNEAAWGARFGDVLRFLFPA